MLTDFLIFFSFRIRYQFWPYLAKNTNSVTSIKSSRWQHHEWDWSGRTHGFLPCLWSHIVTGKILVSGLSVRLKTILLMFHQEPFLILLIHQVFDTFWIVLSCLKLYLFIIAPLIINIIYREIISCSNKWSNY